MAICSAILVKWNLSDQARLLPKAFTRKLENPAQRFYRRGEETSRAPVKKKKKNSPFVKIVAEAIIQNSNRIIFFSCLKVARNEVENASFAQRSAHLDSRIWLFYYYCLCGDVRENVKKRTVSTREDYIWTDTGRRDNQNNGG